MTEFNYSQYCAYRLPCGICTRTNMQCPLPCGTVEVTWKTDVTTMVGNPTTTVAERKEE